MKSEPLQFCKSCLSSYIYVMPSLASITDLLGRPVRVVEQLLLRRSRGRG